METTQEQGLPSGGVGHQERTFRGHVTDELLERLGRRVGATGQREAFTVEAPFTGERLGHLPSCTQEDVREAARRSREAQLAWSHTPFHERAAIFLRFHDRLLRKQEEVLDLIQIESGKARRHAFEEVVAVANVVRYSVNAAQRILRPRRRQAALPGVSSTWEYSHPVGVVGIIAPWNYPLVLATDDLVAALIVGNGAVLKPDQQTSYTALWVQDALLAAGLPSDLLAVVTGSGPELGPTLVEEVDYLAFTGSTETGRIIGREAGARLIGCSLELGGKNPALVLADADLDRTVEALLYGCFASAGQLCVSTERIYVHAAVHRDFLQRFVRAVERLRLGRTLDWSADVGSLTSRRQLDKVQALLDDARQKGARVLVGGRHRQDLGPFFFEPTVLEGVTPEMRIFREEAFGPVVWVDTFVSDEEAVAKANDTRFGLACAIYGKDGETLRNLATWIRAGTVTLNDPYPLGWASVDAPMGGMKESGLGRRHGEQGFRRFTQAQTVVENRGPLLAAPKGEKGAERFAKVMTGMLRAWRRFPVLP